MKHLFTIGLATVGLVDSSKGQADKKFDVKTLEIGAKAPAFTLKDTAGKEYTLDSFKDAKYLMLIFTCNHCPDADAAWGRIQKFADEYKSKGVEVVAIASSSAKGLLKWEHGFTPYGDSFEEMKYVIRDYKLTIPYLYDGDTQVASMAYGALATPHTFIFDAERKLKYHGQFDDAKRSKGPANNSTAQNAMDDLLAGRAIEKPTTRVFGCSTKWIWKQENVKKDNETWKGQSVTVEAVDLDGVKNLVKNDTNRVRLINVWSGSCDTCVSQFPDLTDTYRRFQSRPFDFISIAADSKEATPKVLAQLKKMHSAIPARAQRGLKGQNRTTNNFHFTGGDATKLSATIDAKWDGTKPFTFIVAPGGEIIYRHTGKIDPVTIRKEILKGISGIGKNKAH